MQEVPGANTSPFLDTDDLKMALRVRKVYGVFEKRTPDHRLKAQFMTRPLSQNTVSDLRYN